LFNIKANSAELRAKLVSTVLKFVRACLPAVAKFNISQFISHMFLLLSNLRKKITISKNS